MTDEPQGVRMADLVKSISVMEECFSRVHAYWADIGNVMLEKRVFLEAPFSFTHCVVLREQLEKR